MFRSEVYLHAGLLDAVPRSGIQRRQIMDFIRSLRDSPDAPGDFTDRDETHRTRQIKVVGDYAITYWHDAAVRNVMVVDIRPADR